MIINNLWESAGITSAAQLDTERQALTNRYGSYMLSQVKSRLAVDDSLSALEKYLLSYEEAYICLLLITCKAKDSNGAFTGNFNPFSDAVHLTFKGKETLSEAVNMYIDYLIDEVLASNSINIGNSAVISETLIKAQMHSRIKQEGVDLDNPTAQVLNVYHLAKSEGPYNHIVGKYLASGDVHADDADQSMKTEMARYLQSLNLNLERMIQAIDQGTDEFDEYLAQAWAHALRVRSGDNDPINQVYGDGLVTRWDYDVGSLDTNELEIDPNNIKMAGALYYIYWLDRLGVFDAVNYITIMWARGSFYLPPNGQNREIASKFYKYYKRSDDRLSKEERMMTYRQVFGLGDVPVLQGGVENVEFTRLLDNLMDQIVEYIHKIEGVDVRGSISIEGLSQAIQDLRYNISWHTGGKVAQDVHELYAQLQDCFAILKDPEVAAQLAGGSQRTMWTVLERVSSEHLGKQANISAYKTAAAEGNKMFNIIAGFNHARRHTETTKISSLLRSAEAFIVARSQMSPDNLLANNTPEDVKEVQAEVVDDFEDWD